MTRDMSDGPLSSTVHSALAPVATRVTLTTVPRGSVRWAHVAAGAPNHEATPRSVRAPGCWAGRIRAGSDTTTPAVVVVVARATVVGGVEVVVAGLGAAVVVGAGSCAGRAATMLDVLDVLDAGRTVEFARPTVVGGAEVVGVSTGFPPAGSCGAPG